MKLKNMLEISLAFGKRNLPEILSVCAAAGLITTGVLAFKAGRKADKIIKEKKQDLEDVEPEDKAAKRAVLWEATKEITPIVVPPVIMGGVTVACIFGSNRASSKRIAILSAAYGLSEMNLKDINAKMKEVLGENKAKEVKDAVAKERYTRAENNDRFQYIVPSNGKVRCMDGYLGTPFEATYEEVQRAINRLTAQALSETYVTINDFYDYLGLKHVPVGDDLGWKDENFYGSISPFNMTSTLNDDGVPVLVVMYETDPVGRYWK